MKIESWNGHSIRFVEHGGEWWAVLKDVCDALVLRTDKVHERIQVNHLSRGVEKDEVGRQHQFLIVDEFGIYQAIFQSRKKEARDFQEWTFGVLKSLRESSGLAGFEVFRMLDREHQRQMMQQLSQGIGAVRAPVRVDFIKANTIANKAVSNLHGYQKMVKKAEMSPEMLVERESVLADTVSLMTLNERYSMGISVSDSIYRGKRGVG